MDLIHWRDPKKSGLAFGLSMLLLLSLAAFSVISVISYLLLALLCVTITFRIYKSVIQAVQKSSNGHPFKYVRLIFLLFLHLDYFYTVSQLHLGGKEQSERTAFRSLKQPGLVPELAV